MTGAPGVHVVELAWTEPTPATMPDADTTVLLWVGYPDGATDWCSGWLDADGWHDCASGGLVDGVVIAWANVSGPGEGLEALDAMSRQALDQMEAARDFPTNTCGASRHLALLASAILKGQPCPQLTEEPQHCAESMAWTVAALWSARTELAKQREALQALRQWADAYPVDTFPEPLRQEWQQANEVLAQAGLSLTRMSASNMRHVIGGVRKLADEGLND